MCLLVEIHNNWHFTLEFFSVFFLRPFLVLNSNNTVAKGIPSTMHPNRKQQYSLHIKKIVHANLPQAGFELRSLGPQACVLRNEPPMLVKLIIWGTFLPEQAQTN